MILPTDLPLREENGADYLSELSPFLPVLFINREISLSLCGRINGKDMIRNVVFDLGGVVLDWDAEKVRREYKGDIRLANVLADSYFFKTYWTDFDRGTVDMEHIVNKLSEVSGASVEDSWDFGFFVRDSLVNIPETEHMIRYLHREGYPLYCLSNMSVPFYEYLDKREVFRLFDGKVISALEKTVKPEERIYRILLERYGLNPKETLFIDDLKENVEAAARFGMHTVHFVERSKGYDEIISILNLRRSLREICRAVS